MIRLIAPAIFGISLVASLPAGAEVAVTGSDSSVTVEARGATLIEIVSELKKKTGVRIDLQGTVGSSIDGDFGGSVEDAIAQMLRNDSFVISKIDTNDGPALRIVVFDQGKQSAAIAATTTEGDVQPSQLPQDDSRPIPPADQRDSTLRVLPLKARIRKIGKF
jgi:citrate lyase gamma subunit